VAPAAKAWVTLTRNALNAGTQFGYFNRRILATALPTGLAMQDYVWYPKEDIGQAWDYLVSAAPKFAKSSAFRYFSFKFAKCPPRARAAVERTQRKSRVKLMRGGCGLFLVSGGMLPGFCPRFVDSRGHDRKSSLDQDIEDEGRAITVAIHRGSIG
jgi:hypothetical protein